MRHGVISRRSDSDLPVLLSFVDDPSMSADECQSTPPTVPLYQLEFPTVIGSSDDEGGAEPLQLHGERLPRSSDLGLVRLS